MNLEPEQLVMHSGNRDAGLNDVPIKVLLLKAGQADLTFHLQGYQYCVEVCSTPVSGAPGKDRSLWIQLVLGVMVKGLDIVCRVCHPSAFLCKLVTGSEAAIQRGETVPSLLALPDMKGVSLELTTDGS